jgi:hypothetical protein
MGWFSYRSSDCPQQCSPTPTTNTGYERMRENATVTQNKERCSSFPRPFTHPSVDASAAASIHRPPSRRVRRAPSRSSARASARHHRSRPSPRDACPGGRSWRAITCPGAEQNGDFSCVRGDSSGRRFATGTDGEGAARHHIGTGGDSLVRLRPGAANRADERTPRGRARRPRRWGQIRQPREG